MARTPAPGTRERVLAAASALFYAHGVRAVGMNRVIQEAGTGKNLLYRHFPEKADLVAAYLARVVEIRTAEAAAALAGATSPRDRLLALVREVADKVASPAFRGCAFRNYLAEFPDREDEAPAAVARDYLRRTRRQVAELAPSAEVAERVWLVVDGLYLRAAYLDAGEDREAAGRAAVDLVESLLR
ncbi:TetR/AcrR family transcriptional regulator [Actinokineospora bangkokensis]|uniref:HTH tetR-type domain-containing protein n=1 Tax=Actinokineospora bangkokensis TaxID=1193682 RepID=A0A1Q9LSX1_9PSEU|nr:TetR/AcrR family transcriptional regulator [Actinokineospora bangkokensis]OLR95135.1 hypothetical protein BJP25_07475 [Actinokineospora bangkokensis]